MLYHFLLIFIIKIIHYILTIGFQNTLDFTCVCSNDESPDFNEYTDTVPYVSLGN